MDKYNTLIVFLCVLCIILLLVILSKKSQANETFQTPDPATLCSFTPTDGESHASCVARCFTEIDNDDSNYTDIQKADCKNAASATGCIKKCGATQDQCIIPGSNGLTKCIINPYLDISGDTINQCINICKENTKTCKGCKDFVIESDTGDGQILEGTYTNNLDDYEKCSPEAYSHQFCSPCVKECRECRDPHLCRWVEKTDPNRINDFLSASFVMAVMPENRSALLVWNESRKDVSKYLIFVYKKSDTNLNDQGVQQTPLTVRTIEREFTNVGTNSHLIKGLLNGVTYSITVNKVSTNVEPSSNEKVVKASNTIDIVPSAVNIVNFSKINRDNTIKQEKVQSQQFMDGIKGKTFDITL
jgi:hypothetical protein